MPSISLKNICNYACKGTNLEIRDGEFLVILGSNGAGKTTLINVIAGLVEYQGSVFFDGVSIDELPTNQREVGYLFQNLVLFPHLNATSNIAYGLRAKKWPQTRIEQRVKELLKLVGIEHLGLRYTNQMSGGERQRVALARALAPSPKVLLLDEPMSSMDAQSAKYLRDELKHIQRRLGITTVYVTHDLTEAVDMADRVAIIQKGHVEQVDKPDKILFYPGSSAVSNFIGDPNILDCDYCNDLGRGIMEVGCGGLRLFIPHDGNTVHKIAILPQHIYVSEDKPYGLGINDFQGTITDIENIGTVTRIKIDIAANQIIAEMPNYVFKETDLKKGKDVFIILRMKRIKVYEKNHNV